MYYYAINGEQTGPISEAEIISLIMAGKISSETQIWREGWKNWIAIQHTELAPYLSNPSAPDPPMIPAQHSAQNYYQPTLPFRPAPVLTFLIILFLAISSLIDVVSIGSGFMEIQLLERIEAGDYTDEEVTWNDIRQGAVGMAQIGILILCIIFFCIWIFRMNKNARALGGEEWMEYSAGWSVGWFFIPIANLWKPYQAMREIYNASLDPHTISESDQFPITLWWIVWILSGVVGQFFSRMTLRAEEIAEFIRADWVGIGSDVTTILAAVCAIFMILKTSSAQKKTATQFGYDSQKVT